MKIKPIIEYCKSKVANALVHPFESIISHELSDISSVFTSCLIKNIRGVFQRSITFSIGVNYGDEWLEDALYSILYKYNDIKKESNLAFETDNETAGTLPYKLGEGTHRLKYRNFNIILVVKINAVSNKPKSINNITYTLLTYNLDSSFVTKLEKDMLFYRNMFFSIKKDSPTVKIYKDLHDEHYVYWKLEHNIPKRSFNSMYLPYEQKKLIIQTINNFLSSKELYKKYGIPWNLKILLESDPGLGKDSLIKTIASEYSRNILYITGGKNGKYIPNALTASTEDIKSPLFMISDIDKYPFIINEKNIDIENDTNIREEGIEYKQLFGKMINALDGILSGEGKIIMITTNHIEKFSPAFLRPGRIDLIVHMDYVTPEVFRKYVYDTYGEILPKDIKLNRDNIKVSEMNFNFIFLKQSYKEFIEAFTK